MEDQNTMISPDTKNLEAQNQDEDVGIHNFPRRVVCSKQRLQKIRQGDIGIRFLEKLHLSGLGDGRITVYGARLPHILEMFNCRKIKLSEATKTDCEEILFVILNSSTNKGRQYSAESKMLFALVLLRLVHYAKTGEIGNRDDGYVDEVSWIKPSKYRKGNRTEILPEDLLTPKEIYSIIGKAKNEKERAMLWVMFEGAFRPGELLNLRMGGIEFKDNYVLVSTVGKTGKKRVPLVYSFKPLLEWVAKHPQKDEPKSYLWYSHISKQKRISYRYLQEILKSCANEAGIKKSMELPNTPHATHLACKETLRSNPLCIWQLVKRIKDACQICSSVWQRC